MSFGLITLNQYMVKKSKLCYADTNNITVYIKTEDLYLD